MSIQLRRKIGYWFMLLLGIAILSLQLKKYFDNTLEFRYEEIIVTVIALFMVLNPASLLDLLGRIINTKYGKNTNES